MKGGPGTRRDQMLAALRSVWQIEITITTVRLCMPKFGRINTARKWSLPLSIMHGSELNQKEISPDSVHVDRRE
jgi:hypothetical protein